MSNLIRNCWYVAGWSTDFSRTPEQRWLLGEPIVLYRRTDGGIVALEDRCAHRMAPLSAGRVEDDAIRCMYHGLKFGSDGRCMEIPGQELIPDRACVRRYPVVEKNSWVWVWMGDPSLADDSRIANSKALDDPSWILKTGHLDYEANYELINDNLLDLTHLTYVHAGSFGADEAWSRNRPKIETLDNGIRSSRWIINSPPIPPLGKAAQHERVDIWTSFDFIMPGTFLLYTAMYAAGTARLCGEGEPGAEHEILFNNFTSQAVVPLSEQTSRYYFSWGPGAAFGTEADAQIMIDVAKSAFLEDKVMIEAQQRIINANPQVRPMPTSADKAITIFQRMMKAQDVARDAPVFERA
ncbi:vanillate O-demethylase monooxygenase subunit [Sphingobium sp. B1D7B]|uniref:aromatic ring-hydroxylating dioxygenase subunit alpha n=1 Tax=Sphingobium sp. B1D7B TaxID=2940578 RepID=UPI00222585FE|nr:aromatic ring-hydroxylating dioxygenase subunit alpha [Sphingobium sp. B1D7B]MCW2406915.1 vanillate O-demethylase monooxygenase subunit [Sphingobium sp. B1D7B]